MIKYTCERGTYMIANLILKRKVVIQTDYQQKISKIKYNNVKMSTKQDNKPKNR
jgi:hypothetical protein